MQSGKITQQYRGYSEEAKKTGFFVDGSHVAVYRSGACRSMAKSSNAS